MQADFGFYSNQYEYNAGFHSTPVTNSSLHPCGIAQIYMPGMGSILDRQFTSLCIVHNNGAQQVLQERKRSLEFCVVY